MAIFVALPALLIVRIDPPISPFCFIASRYLCSFHPSIQKFLVKYGHFLVYPSSVKADPFFPCDCLIFTSSLALKKRLTIMVAYSDLIFSNKNIIVAE